MISRPVWRILTTWGTWQASRSWRSRSSSQEQRWTKSLSLSTNQKQRNLFNSGRSEQLHLGWPLCRRRRSQVINQQYFSHGSGHHGPPWAIGPWTMDQQYLFNIGPPCTMDASSCILSIFKGPRLHLPHPAERGWWKCWLLEGDQIFAEIAKLVNLLHQCVFTQMGYLLLSGGRLQPVLCHPVALWQPLQSRRHRGFPF